MPGRRRDPPARRSAANPNWPAAVRVRRPDRRSPPPPTPGPAQGPASLLP